MNDYKPQPMSWVEWIAVACCIAGLLSMIWLFCASASHAQVSNAQSNQIEINVQAAYGLGYQSNSVLMNYCEPGTTQALFGNSNTVFVPANTTGQAINLATMFPNINSALLWGIQDISNPGQLVSIGMAANGSRYTLAPGGFQVTRVSGSAPTLYVDNPSTNNYAILKVFCLAN